MNVNVMVHSYFHSIGLIPNANLLVSLDVVVNSCQFILSQIKL